MSLPKYTNDFDVVSCDASGAWLSDAVEEKYEKDFFELLHSCHSYEEFMMRKDIQQIEFSDQQLNYLSFKSEDELGTFIKNHYKNAQ